MKIAKVRWMFPRIFRATTETSSSFECYRLPSLCRFHILWNFPIAHFRLSLSNRFILFSRFRTYLLCSSKITHKNAPRRQPVWAHRDEITSYASRLRRCNAIATTQVQRHQYSPFLLSLVVATLLHAPCIARFSSSDRSTL